MIRLLIVDDNFEFRTMLREYLKCQELDLEVFEASTGEMGVAKSSFVKPDIVLMDINLPHVNGIKATTVIKEDYPECDVIILTMFDTAQFKRIAEEIEVSAFIGKSDVYDRLIPAIKDCIKKRESKAVK